ncbi:MAG: ABC transporter ATP-binding protein [Pseudomonadota bacterium]
MEKKESIISLSSVFKSYNSEKTSETVLKGISFDVQKKEMVDIRGVSGSGKSTLLNIIGGIDTVSSGKVKVCNQDLSTMNQSELTKFRRDNIGFVFQFHNLISSLTALENVLTSIEAQRSVKKKDISDAMAMLDYVGLSNKAHQFPTQLSGGEQQRVAIARAAVKKPPVFLADEPTGNLDENNGNNVMKLMKELQSDYDMTMIIVTHNPLLSSYTDRSFFMKDGVISVEADDK